jgi:2-dehydro-3-deoxygluconokinase
MAERIVCFGELLLRLGAPGRQLLLQTPLLEVHVGGAEANVAVSLARLGHDAAMVSVVPDNALGAAAVGELRRHGVDTRAITTAPGRMGLYFVEPGAIQRPTEILYDRAHSAFANLSPDYFDWKRLLHGAACLHLSGVTPALGADSARLAIGAARAARAQGLFLAFDGNYRAKLWERWKGDSSSILKDIMSQADIVFADHRDIAIALGVKFPELPPQELVSAAAQAAFAAFPQLARLASTIRTQRSVDEHALAAVMVGRDGSVHATDSYQVGPIVDRIGAGDAFAAGVLHGLRSGMADGDSLRFGLAAACLKHSLPGDFNLASAEQISAFVREQKFDVRR